jgi:type I restriction-modification system DNA methylase subunit
MRLKQFWIAADILRGSLDPPDYRQPIMTLFIKRLNDTFEETTEKMIKEGKSEKKPMATRIGITSLFQKKQDGFFYLKQQRILEKRLTTYVEL